MNLALFDWKFITLYSACVRVASGAVYLFSNIYPPDPAIYPNFELYPTLPEEHIPEPEIDDVTGYPRFALYPVTHTLIGTSKSRM